MHCCYLLWHLVFVSRQLKIVLWVSILVLFLNLSVLVLMFRCWVLDSSRLVSSLIEQEKLHNIATAMHDPQDYLIEMQAGWTKAKVNKLLHITYMDRISNEEVLKRSGSTELQDIVTERRFRLAGQILRLPTHCHTNIAVQWSPGRGRCKRGHSKKTCRRTYQEDLRRVLISWVEAKTLASDSSSWWKAAAQCALMRRRN